MTTEIRKLDADTIAKIAAGEVVTRPAAAVKELVENSLDAGAKRVEVTVEGDGTDLLRVSDDGRGMTEADAERAVERHATSKLDDADEVDRVTTLGFRGEALPSIASAAARLEITTSAGDGSGTSVVVADGDPEVRPAGRARGTTVTVRGLFADRPARRRSLASPKAEFARVSDAVTRYALTHPGVRFSLVHDGREVFATPGSGDYAEALMGAYDRTAAGQSTTFAHETEFSAGGATGPLRVEGVACYPSVTRARRDHVHVAVNGRPLADPDLRRAVVDGYGSLLPDGRAPVAVANVSLPPGAVDANVHPAKAEVEFRDADAVTAAVEAAVGDALATADLRRAGEVAMDVESSLAPLPGDSTFADVSVIGQYRGLYLLCEADDDLLVVDQHAAHERVNYERLREALDEGVPSVDVDPPETVSLSPADAAVAEAHADELARLGFAFESFGGGTYRVTGLPAPLGRVADVDALRDLVSDLRAGESPDDARDDLLKDLACHPSLRAGDDLSTAEAADLVERLGQCDQPYACPHGRPTVVSIAEETLVRGFERGGTRLG